MYNREEYEHWIQQYLKPRYPELVREFPACLNGYERIKTNNRIDKGSLNSVIRAVRSSRAPLFNTAIHFLRDLSTHHPQVSEVILTMSSDKHWYVRCHALLSLSHRMPKNIILTILKKGLQDRSARVRGVAAWQAQSLRVMKLIPDLENQFAIEPRSEVKHSIEFHLRLMRDGYFLERKDRESPFIWIPTSDGIRGTFISQKDIDTKGIQAIISEIGKNPYG